MTKHWTWRVELGSYVLLQLATTEMGRASRRGTLAGFSRRTRASAAGLVQIGFVSEQHQEKSRIIIPQPANSIRLNWIGLDLV
jgi:hypothetical protein